MGYEIEVRDAVKATGHGLATKHHELALVNDTVQLGAISVGDCALLADESYKNLRPLYLNNNLNQTNPNASEPIPSFRSGLSSWVCVKTWNFPGQNDSFGTMLPNAFLQADLSKFNIDGFFAALFRAARERDHGYHYVLAFRGTEKPSCSDWINDVQQALGTFSLQYAHVSEIIGRRLRDFTRDACTLTFTGHSLGGGLAALAGTLIPYVPTVTFNAAGLNKATAEEAHAYMTGIGFDDEYRADYFPSSLARSTIHANYNVKYEILSTLQKDPILCAQLLGQLLGRTAIDALDAGTASVIREATSRPFRGAAIAGGGMLAAPFVLPVAAEATGTALSVAAPTLAKMVVKVLKQGGLPSPKDWGFGDFEIPCIEGKNIIDLHLMEQVKVALGLHTDEELAKHLTWAQPGAEINAQ